MRYRKDDGADPPILPLFPAHLRTKLYSIVVDLQFDATTIVRLLGDRLFLATKTALQ